MHNTHTGGQDPDCVGDQLGERGCQALAMRARANAGLDLAGRAHDHFNGLSSGRDVHAARSKSRTAIAGALGERREPNPEKPAARAGLALPGIKFRQIDLRGCDVERLGIAAFVEHQSNCRRIGKAADEIAFTNFDRTDAASRGGFVHQPLHRKGDDRTRHAAIGRHGAGVGRHGAGAATIGAQIVWPRQFGHCHQRFDPAGGRETRISADIGDDVG